MKFASDLDAKIYSLTLDGGPDEEAGDVTEVGAWYGRVHLSHAEQEDLGAPTRDYIVREDEYGMVDVVEYATEDEAKAAFLRIEEGLSDLYRGEED